jgi:hypothetical protein
MAQESDGIHEMFEHTLQVGTGILTEHARGAADRRAAAAREQAATLNAQTAVTQTTTAKRDDLDPELAEAARVTELSNARPVAEAVLNGPGKAPRARRSRGTEDRSAEQAQGR